MNQTLYEWVANLLPGTVLYHASGKVFVKMARSMTYNVGRDYLFCASDGYITPIAELVDTSIPLEMFLAEFTLHRPDPIIVDEAKPAPKQLEMF